MQLPVAWQLYLVPPTRHHWCDADLRGALAREDKKKPLALPKTRLILRLKERF